MCGRYSLSTPADLVAETFALATRPELAPRWNIAPTEAAPVVRSDAGGSRRLALLRWGLVPDGSAGPGEGPQHINARGETADTLPAFRDSFRARRCLIPADGFYEWRAGRHGRQPYHIRRRDRRPLAFAGLWSRWQGPGSEPLESFAILTCPPSELVRQLHDRMPVILAPETWGEWLTRTDPSPLKRLLVPWTGNGLEAVAVSSYVNRAGNEGPECLRAPAPPAPAAQRSLF